LPAKTVSHIGLLTGRGSALQLVGMRTMNGVLLCATKRNGVRSSTSVLVLATLKSVTSACRAVVAGWQGSNGTLTNGQDPLQSSISRRVFLSSTPSASPKRTIQTRLAHSMARDRR